MNGSDAGPSGPAPGPDLTGGSSPESMGQGMREARLAAMVADVARDNPSVPLRIVQATVQRAYDQYLSAEAGWDENPLGYTSWMNVGDGPMTGLIYPKDKRRQHRLEQQYRRPRDLDDGPGDDDHDDDDWDREPSGPPPHPEPDDHEQQHHRENPGLADRARQPFFGGDHDPRSAPVDLSEFGTDPSSPRADEHRTTIRSLVRKHGPEVAKVIWKGMQRR